jgi:ABC-2 type transport system permease protein
MAGVSGVQREAGQLRLIAELRWQMFVNSRRRLDLAARGLVGLTVGTAVFGMGVLLGIGSWTALHTNSPLMLTALLWFVFATWQLLPILVTGFGAQADLGSLLRFPVRYPTFVLLTLAYGLADPVAVAALYWLICVLMGIGVAERGALLWAVLALISFAAVNLLLSRAVFTWLERWLAQRRTREILGVAFFIVMMSFQFIGPLSDRWGRQAMQALPAVKRLAPFTHLFPPGMAVSVIEAGWRGEGERALAALGSLSALGLAAGWVLGIRLRAQYRGENLSEGRAGRADAGPRRIRQGWRLLGLSPAVAALLEKELRCLARNTAQYLPLVAPLILVVLAGRAREVMPLAGTAFFFPGCVAYCLLVTAGSSYNSLGYDGAGVALIFATPVRFRDVLVAKNMLQTAVFAVEVLVTSVLAVLVSGRPDPAIVAVTLTAALFALPLNFTAGNLVSLYFPRRLEFGTLRRQNASGMAVLITLSIQVAILGISAVVYLLSCWAGKVWLAEAAFLALAVIVLIAYKWVLDASTRIAEKQRDVLMTELCR